MRYSLRTLLILTLLGPPALAWVIMFATVAIEHFRRERSFNSVTWETAGPGATSVSDYLSRKKASPNEN